MFVSVDYVRYVGYVNEYVHFISDCFLFVTGNFEATDVC